MKIEALMKIEITGHGIFGATGEIPIGSIVEVKEEPLGWKGRYRVVGRTEGKTPVTNEPKTYDEMTRAELDKLAEDRGVDIKEAKNKADVIAALQLADEAAKSA